MPDKDRLRMRLLLRSLTALAVNGLLTVALLTYSFLHHLHWGHILGPTSFVISNTIMMISLVLSTRLATAQKQVPHVR